MWVFMYCSVHTCGCEGCEVLGEGGESLHVGTGCLHVVYMWVCCGYEGMYASRQFNITGWCG